MSRWRRWSYLFGFAFWGASSAPYSVWNETADDRAAGRALLEHFPESGVYYLPARGNPAEQRGELYEAGPTGFVILDRDGRPEVDPSIMAGGFVLNAVFIALLAVLLRVTLPAGPTYGDRLKIALCAAAVGVVMIDFGRAVWWAMPWDWELVQAFYNFVAWGLAGAILAYFVRPEDATATG